MDIISVIALYTGPRARQKERERRGVVVVVGGGTCRKIRREGLGFKSEDSGKRGRMDEEVGALSHISVYLNLVRLGPHVESWECILFDFFFSNRTNSPRHLSKQKQRQCFITVALHIQSCYASKPWCSDFLCINVQVQETYKTQRLLSHVLKGRDTV